MTGFDRIRAVAEAGGLSGLRMGILIEQDHIQQRLVNLDAIVVFDKAEFAKSIHEKAHAGARGADQFRHGLL